MQRRTFFQCAGKTSRERHLKSVEYPRGSKCRYNQRVEAAPRQPVEPRRDICFDDLLILHHECRVNSENRINLFEEVDPLRTVWISSKWP